MKFVIAACVVATGLVAAMPAFAGSDDAKWIARCLRDNQDAKVAVEVITRYCTCMNNQMDDNETLSISAWERTPPGKVAMRKCDRESGWH